MDLVHTRYSGTPVGFSARVARAARAAIATSRRSSAIRCCSVQNDEDCLHLAPIHVFPLHSLPFGYGEQRDLLATHHHHQHYHVGPPVVADYVDLSRSAPFRASACRNRAGTCGTRSPQSSTPLELTPSAADPNTLQMESIAATLSRAGRRFVQALLQGRPICKASGRQLAYTCLDMPVPV